MCTKLNIDETEVQVMCKSVEEHQCIHGRKLTETGVYFVYTGGKVECNSGTEADIERH